MPKTPQLNGYQISVDRVIEPGQVTADRKIAVLVTAGEAVVLAAEREYGAFLIDEAPWEVGQRTPRSRRVARSGVCSVTA